MNDSVYACYDPSFCPSTIQPSDLQHNPLQQHFGELDLQSSTLYYNSHSISSDLPVQQHKHNQQLNFALSSANASQQTHLPNSSTTTHHSNNVGRDDNNLIATALNNVTTFSAQSSIPFVQIHTTDVQPQRRSFGNVFRRAATSQAEIKSEPIKSENADSGKDRVNATPTPPVRNASCNSSERVTTPAINQNSEASHQNEPVDSDQTEHLGSQNLLDLSGAYESVRKCNLCRFICLDDVNMEEHVLGFHTNAVYCTAASRTRNLQISCPGCSNMFYAFKSLETHLIEDHFTSLVDTKKLMEAVDIAYSNTSNSTAMAEQTETSKSDEPPSQQRKSRIYLKNVECLREPRREPMDGNQQSKNCVSDGFFPMTSFNGVERNADLTEILNSDFNDIAGTVHLDKQHLDHADMSAIVSKPKQKISIKSVDVLREPGLLRRGFEMENRYGNLTNACNDLDFESFEPYQSQPTNDVVGMSPSGPDGNRSCDKMNHDESNFEKRRRPKIYIKNVDILKEPIIFSGLGANGPLGMPDANSSMSFNFLTSGMQQNSPNTDYLSNAANQVFDTENMPQMPMGGNTMADTYIFESSSSSSLTNSNKTNNLLTEIVGGGMTENYSSFTNTSGGVNSFLPYSMLDCGMDSASHAPSTTPIITEPTPPPAPVFGMQETPDTLMDVAVSTPTSTSTVAQPKQKIFIKNVDILKAPQFQEPRERGTLHLRTVDELNLMNRNEVESLIAPNLENNASSSSGNCNLRMNSGPDEGFELATEHMSIAEEDEPPDHAMFYEENSLKLQDYTSPFENGWVVDDYDLGDDIDCIITDSVGLINNMTAMPPPLSPGSATAVSLPKMGHDIEAPQMSMISIRDIEELTGPNPTQQQQHQLTMASNLMPLEHTPSLHSHGAIPPVQKQERAPSPNVSSVPIGTATVVVGTNSGATHLPLTSSTLSLNIPLELPPLTPVTNFTCGARETSTATCNASSMPVPPLVPVSTLLPFTTAASTSKHIVQAATQTATPTTISASATTTPAERGRIYVANNLMQTPAAKREMNPLSAQKSTETKTCSFTGGTSVRGRPFGSNRAENAAKLNKPRPDAAEIVLKCSVRGCAFRFKKSETLAYHERCHDRNSLSSQAKQCPECKSKDFSNWNTLHTHLWRTHQVDMELYSCSQCPFKTPIYSRLVNTHTKIHSEERNYKCDQCGKAFKNTKQLKNHRRWHRNHSTAASASNLTGEPTLSSGDVTIGGGVATDATVPPHVTSPELHRCNDCGAAFSHSKTLREHSCKNSDTQQLCNVCGHAASSKSSLKLHMFTHENAKRLKCAIGGCTYSTSDHNAFRRHKMTHENTKMYLCPHCNYKSIQSVAYQKHVLLKHPDAARTLIHKCEFCSYSTVNRTLFAVHQIKHRSPPLREVAAAEDAEQNNASVELIEMTSLPANNLNAENDVPNDDDDSSSQSPPSNVAPVDVEQHGKIKVKSNLLITDDSANEEPPSPSNEFITIEWSEKERCLL